MSRFEQGPPPPSIPRRIGDLARSAGRRVTETNPATNIEELSRRLMYDLSYMYSHDTPQEYEKKARKEIHAMNASYDIVRQAIRDPHQARGAFDYLGEILVQQDHWERPVSQIDYVDQDRIARRNIELEAWKKYFTPARAYRFLQEESSVVSYWLDQEGREDAFMTSVHVTKMLCDVALTPSIPVATRELCATLLADHYEVGKSFARGSGYETRFSTAIFYSKNDAVKEKMLATLDQTQDFYTLGLLYRYHSQEHSVTERINTILAPFGIQEKTLLDAWNKTAGITSMAEELFAQAFAEHIAAMRSLESKQPGIIKTLNEKFGIVSFGFYPEELLIEQYQNIENAEFPYGIGMESIDDWCGLRIWERDQTRKVITALWQSARERGHSLRMCEVGSVFQAAKLLTSLDRRYGGRHKIDYAFVHAHGGSGDVMLGSEKQQMLTRPGIQEAGMQKLRQVFAQDFLGVLFTCNTGTDDSIGRDLSNQWGIRVTAPDGPCSMKGMRMKQEPGQAVQFDVDFGDKAKPVLFVGGEKREL